MKSLFRRLSLLLVLGVLGALPGAASNPPCPDAACVVGHTAQKIGRVTRALVGSGARGGLHLGKDAVVVGHALLKGGVRAGKDTVAVAKAVGKAGHHTGHDVVGTGKAVVRDAKK